MGWNLVANPSGSLPVTVYNWGDDSPGYTELPPRTPLETGSGYWAFFDQPTIVDVSKDCSGGTRRPDRPCTPPSFSVVLPPDQFEMIGNPDPFAVSVDGADVIYTYDPGAHRYVQGSMLEIGQGAWAYSLTGSALTFTAVIPYR